MPNWTPQQQAAIADEGGTLLVSASAGSGKTAVLVERAFRLIAERGVAADRLLILTFSNAAAAELRSRIALRLEDALRREPQNLYLRRQRILLQRANISTVSAFCMQLLRENFSRLSIPPDFRVADESISYDLGHTVLASVLEDSYQDPAFCEFASVFGRARSDGAASDAILQLYQHLRALPFFESALAELCALYHGENSVCATPWGHELLKNAVDAATAGSSMCAAALHFIDDTPELLPYRDALLCDADCFLRVRQLLCDARWDDARIALATYEAPAL
ncbi:MAG: UvrD-helicase domain-containing protein, partial [Pygmaiobacter sp.]